MSKLAVNKRTSLKKVKVKGWTQRKMLQFKPKEEIYCIKFPFPSLPYAIEMNST